MRLPALTAGGSSSGARWAVSFADLCMVLLGFLLLLQAHKGDPAALGAGLRAAFGGPQPRIMDEAAAPLFESGEAVLLAPARSRFAAVGRRVAAGSGVVHVESVGTDADARRFDSWELAAARTASIARAIQEGGLESKRIDVSIGGTGAVAKGQHVRVTVSSARS
jgi:hypothetical protein